MGLERDYIMRQLKMLFDLIQKIIGHRQKGEDKLALEQIRFFYTCLKIDSEVHSESIEKLLNFLVNKKKLTNEQLEMVAYVLMEEGELTPQAAGQKMDFFRKAYIILEKVDRESTNFSMVRQMKLAELKEYLN
jgi:uncharacterized tellurite resistance protein B-like protein